MSIHNRKDKLKAEPKWPWLRRPGESKRQHELFMIYRDMPKRSLAKMAREMTPSPSQKTGRFSGTYARNWVTDHEWETRARAWDNFVQMAKDRKLRDEKVKWERRRLHHLDDSYEMAEKMKAVASEMFETPIAQTIEEQVDADGKPRIIIHNPGKWSFQTAVDMMKASIEIKTAVLTAVDDPDGDADVDDETIQAIQDAHFNKEDLRKYLDEAEANGPEEPYEWLPSERVEMSDGESFDSDEEGSSLNFGDNSEGNGEPDGDQGNAASDSCEVEGS